MMAEVKLEETQTAAVVVSPKEEPVKDNKAEEKVAGMTNGAVEKEKAATEDAETKLEEPKKGHEEKIAGMANGAVENKKGEAEDGETKKLEEPRKGDGEKIDRMANGAVENETAAAEDGEVRKLEEPMKGEEEKNVDDENHTSSPVLTLRSTFKEMKSSSFKEESNLLSDLKEHEKKALAELKAKLEEAILGNTLFSTEEQKIEEKASEEISAKEEKSREGEGEKSEEVKTEQKEGEKLAEEGKTEQQKEAKSAEEGKSEPKEEEQPVGEEKLEKGEQIRSAEEEKPAEEAAKYRKEDEEKDKQNLESGMNAVEVDKDISLWGVPLLPSKGEDGTNVVLLKFLRARDFRVNEAFVMLKNTLQWRKEFKTDTILDEEFDSDLSAASYLKGVDREGHPICYNIYGVFENEKLYRKTFGTGERREKFLRWRVREMEKSIQQLDFEPGGICSFLQINDLKNTPGPSKRDLRLATKHAVAVLQDNYPEFVARNVRISAKNDYFFSAFWATGLL